MKMIPSTPPVMSMPPAKIMLGLALFLALELLLAGGSVTGAEARASDEAALRQFDQQVRPVLRQFCVRCHGPEEQQADLRLDQLSPDLVAGDAGEHWEEVLDQLNSGKMPPKDEPQPAPAQRSAVTGWVAAELRHAAEVRRSTGGRNVLRRLTRYEYNNTLRDLLGIRMDFAQDLPPESAAQEGFANNSTVLVTSALHMEYYQRIAKQALEKALAFGDPPQPFVLSGPVEPKDLRGREGRGKKMGSWDPRAGGAELKTDMIIQREFTDLPTAGPVLVRVRAGAIASRRGDLPQMQIELGFDGGSSARPVNQLASVVVDAPRDNPRVYEFTDRCENFPLVPQSRRSQFLALTNAFDVGTSDLAVADVPQLFVNQIEIVAPYYPVWPPETRTRIIGPAVPAGEQDRDAYVRGVLDRFMLRAYRRPPLAGEVDRMHELYLLLRSRGSTFESALIDVLSAVLCAPGFLMIAEPAPAEQTVEQARRLNDYELASRLSYFLWSTMPDDQLFTLAAEQKLSDPAVLRAQVRRMLDDGRSRQFAEHFTSQWLDLESLYRVAVNPEYFPRFKDEMKDTLREETIQFVSSLLREDGSCLTMLDSDFAVLNAPLARYYGVPGVAGVEFQKVPLLPEYHRGGLLTQGSVLLGNSSGDDTHPVKRGVWLLERLLGDPPPPPPPSVPTLAQEDDPANAGRRLSLKEKLLVHRQQGACFNCHRKIDPWGLAFENYDGVGQWRDSTVANTDDLRPAAKSRKQAGGGKKNRPRSDVPQAEVDPRTTLPDQTEIRDLAELKAYLLENRRHQFAETLVRKVLSYALGRYLEFSDAEAVHSLKADLEQNDYRLRRLLETVVLSDPFRTK